MESLLRYKINTRGLPEHLASKAIEFRCDPATKNFLDECEANAHSRSQLLLSQALSLIMPDYEVHGLLGLYPMFLLDQHRWKILLDGESRVGSARESLLDIGAGQGFVTKYAKEFFKNITTTETSHTMAKHLINHGFENYVVDIALDFGVFYGRKFSAVSLLNVLDRCEYPLTLLSRAIDFMDAGGLLLIADPLPLKPYVRGRSRILAQKETLPALKSEVWEECFAHFAQNVLEPRGLEIVRFTRLPYLFKGDARIHWYGLDDFVVVCRKKAEALLN